ncbi:hypothetical protein IID22_01280 [Patescibacteria group bacterium]|nr:hypothetical protein [Patescibacteria group bacterium]
MHVHSGFVGAIEYSTYYLTGIGDKNQGNKHLIDFFISTFIILCTMERGLKRMFPGVQFHRIDIRRVDPEIDDINSLNVFDSKTAGKITLHNSAEDVHEAAKDYLGTFVSLTIKQQQLKGEAIYSVTAKGQQEIKITLDRDSEKKFKRAVEQMDTSRRTVVETNMLLPPKLRAKHKPSNI